MKILRGPAAVSVEGIGTSHGFTRKAPSPETREPEDGPIGFRPPHGGLFELHSLSRNRGTVIDLDSTAAARSLRTVSVRSLLALTVCVLVQLAPSLAAQSTPPAPELASGFGSSALWSNASNPFAVRGFVLVPDALGPGRDSLFVAISSRIERYDDGSTVPVINYTTPGHTILEQIVWLPPSATGTNLGSLAFSTFRPATLFTVPVADMLASTNPTPVQQPLPANTFDLATSADGSLVLVSANPSWPAPGSRTGIWMLDPLRAAPPREILRLDGPSGPIAFLPGDGGLAYATQSDIFPNPPGSVDLIQFPRSVLDRVTAPGAQPGSLADAVTIRAGLDSAYGLALDPSGGLLVSDVSHGTVRRIFDSARPEQEIVLAGGDGISLQMQWVPGNDSRVPFEPYQQPTAGRLLLMTSNFSTFAAVHELRPLRPGTFAEPPVLFAPSSATWRVEGMPANQPCTFFLALGTPAQDEFTIGTFGGLPLWLSSQPMVAVPAPALNSDGASQLDVPVLFPAPALDLSLFAVSFVTAPDGTLAPMTSRATAFMVR